MHTSTWARFHLEPFLFVFKVRLLTCVVRASPLCNHLKRFDSFIKPGWTARLCLEGEEKETDNKEADRRSRFSASHLSHRVTYVVIFHLSDTGRFMRNHTCNMYECAAIGRFQRGVQHVKRRARLGCLGDSFLRSYVFSPLSALIWLTYSSCC